jgi:AcrR family transcriptional regulator
MVFQSKQSSAARTAPDDVRDVILDAADSLFQRYGYQKTTVDDIAREARIGKGTIYLHFKSKEAVALSCLSRLNERLFERMRVAGRRCGPPADRLRQMILTRILYRFEAAQTWAGALDDLYAVLRPTLLERREQTHEREAEILAEILVEGRVVGAFNVDDAMLTARSIVLATDALLPYSLSARQLGERAEIEAKAVGVVNLLLGGILKRDEGSTGPPEQAEAANDAGNA